MAKKLAALHMKNAAGWHPVALVIGVEQVVLQIHAQTCRATCTACKRLGFTIRFYFQYPAAIFDFADAMPPFRGPETNIGADIKISILIHG